MEGTDMGEGMKEFGIGTKPTRYALAKRATLEKIAADRDELVRINKALVKEWSEEVDGLKTKIVDLEEECGQEEYRSFENSACAETLARKNDILESEIKKAFWAGFEIAYCTTDLNIQPRWDEYKKLRGI